jgi:hypothetical protein
VIDGPPIHYYDGYVISTVTTSTVTTVTSVTSAITGTPQTIALFAVLTLVVLLVQKEILSTATAGWQRAWSRALNLGLVPLAVAFAGIAAARVSEVLR